MSDPIVRLRLVSVLEAVSFLVLLTFSVLKRTNDWDVGVTVMGPVHGVLFIVYVLLVLDVRPRLGWNLKTTLLVAGASVLPVAPFYVERWLRDQHPVTARG